MEITSVARRYGGALYDFAVESDARDAVRADCVGVLELLESSTEFADFVADPTIPPADADEALAALFAGRVDAATSRFLSFLVSKRRLDQLPGVCAVFEERVCEELGVIKVAVTSAHELAPEQLEAIKGKLEARYHKTVDAETRVDPSLIGGFVIKEGDHIRDFSLATKLERFEQSVLDAKHEHAKIKG